jgi:hypothetical protein
MLAGPSTEGGQVRRSLCLVVVALAATLAIPTTAAAAPVSTVFAVSGHEYAFTPTVGCFAGSALGNAGDRAAWNTCVEHDPLGSVPTYVNGGRFAMATRSPAGSYDYVTGTFVHHGGTIETINPGANCTNQRYLVTGALENVSTSTTSGGSGTFAATLTHFRTRIFGRCIAYRATVVGTASFAY